MSIIHIQFVNGGATWTKPAGAVLVKIVPTANGGPSEDGDTFTTGRIFLASILGTTESVGIGAGEGFGAWWADILGGGGNTFLVVTYGDPAHAHWGRGLPPRGLKWLPRRPLDFTPQPEPATDTLYTRSQPIKPGLPALPTPRRQSVRWTEPALQDAVYAFDQIITPVLLPVPAPREDSRLWMEPDVDDRLHAFDQIIAPVRLPDSTPREVNVRWEEPDLDDALYAFDQIVMPTLPLQPTRREFSLWPEPALQDALYAFDQIVTPVRLPDPAPRREFSLWPEPALQDSLYAFDQIVTPVRLPDSAPRQDDRWWPEPGLNDAIYARSQDIVPVRHPVPAPFRQSVLWMEPAFNESLRAFHQDITPPVRPLPSAWPPPITSKCPEPEFFEALRVNQFCDRGKPEYPFFRPWPRIITTLYPEFVPQPLVGIPGEPPVPREPGPILTADDDVAQAVVRKWNGTAAILAAVPGGLQRGRLSSFQPNVQPVEPERKRRETPYATFGVAKSREGLANTGNFYLDFRMAVIEIRGTRDQVEPVLPLIRAAFHEQRLETQQAFLACILIDDAELTEDPARRLGEDVWIGTVRLEVWTDRDQ